MSNNDRPSGGSGGVQWTVSARQTMFRARLDYRLVVLEIADWLDRKNFPENPPEWALEACRQLRDEELYAVRSILSSGTGPKPTRGDAEMLDRIADIYTDFLLRAQLTNLIKNTRGHPKSVRSLIIYVLTERGLYSEGNSSSETNLRRLQYLWKNQRERRLDLAAMRFAPKFASHRKQHAAANS